LGMTQPDPKKTVILVVDSTVAAPAAPAASAKP
jgi:hypothetical protein